MTCLFSPYAYDLKGLLRGNGNYDEIKDLLIKAVPQNGQGIL